ncbi:MAG: WbuC family cupin fold metalloprotein [Acidobacteria bacterium]|nr:WbuC family cupin fold metalloprotein [Acidobacteriota bacterium]
MAGRAPDFMSESAIQLLDSALFDTLVKRALASPRLRTNHNFHASLDEDLHRFLNVMGRGTYVTPHRHVDPPKPEAFVVLAGEIAFFTFDDDGRIATRHKLGRDPVGIDVAAGVWHSMAVLSPHAICYEVKPGPYAAANDKTFAPWAPREGDPRAAEYLEWLTSQAEG